MTFTVPSRAAMEREIGLARRRLGALIGNLAGSAVDWVLQAQAKDPPEQPPTP